MGKIIFDVTEINEGTRFMSIPQYKMRLLILFTFKEKANTKLLASKDGTEFIASKFSDFEIVSLDLWENISCKFLAKYNRYKQNAEIFKQTRVRDRYTFSIEMLSVSSKSMKMGLVNNKLIRVAA